jgi:hypothetical protein
MDLWQALWIYTHFEPLPPIFWKVLGAAIVFGLFALGVVLLIVPIFLSWDLWAVALAIRAGALGLWVIAGGIVATAWALGGLTMED